MIYRSDLARELTHEEMDNNLRACLGVHNLLHVQHKETTNVGGGTFTSGAWRTRILNHVAINNIGASLASNQLTLQEGQYIVIADSQAYKIGAHYTKIYSITDSVDILFSSMSYNNPTAPAQTLSTLFGAFSITKEHIIELQHKCSSTFADYGFGTYSTDFFPIIYVDLKIWKVA